MSINNDASVLGLLIVLLAGIFYTSSLDSKFWKTFYKFCPSLLLCYFLPSVFNSFGIISGENSKLYFVASRYLLPASLVLLTLSIDLKGILSLGPKALIMFLSGTLGIVIGGPLTILVCYFFLPETYFEFSSNETWRGMATIAGSWIGGGANQTAMKEMFSCSDYLFSSMITVDVIVANIWMGFLLYGAGNYKRIDKFFNSDSSMIEDLKVKLKNYQSKLSKIPDLSDYVIIFGIAFGSTGFAHFIADSIVPFLVENYYFLSKFSLTSKFFWLILISTSLGLVFSFSSIKKYEGAGASKIGSLFLYILVSTIGMKMDAFAIFYNIELFFLGFVWMLIHVLIILLTAKIIKAPFFFVAVGSQANIGGAASAPIVASAFHPSLAPVGVLLAVFGYAVGTYAAWFCAILMQALS